MPAILVGSGRAAVAKAIKEQPLYLAWGTGLQSWDGLAIRPSENASATELIAETGRRLVTQTMYVIEDNGGKIQVSTGKFTESATPTNFLYLRFAYEFLDGQSDTIRELGVFVGGTTIPRDQSVSKNDYYLPSEVTSKGQLLVSEYIDKLQRGPQIKQQFEFVIQF
ncbi:TPA: hypothetical protein ACODIZ_003669 [Salmonella enterica subsp. enterica serovar Newport]